MKQQTSRCCVCLARAASFTSSCRAASEQVSHKAKFVCKVLRTYLMFSQTRGDQREGAVSASTHQCVYLWMGSISYNI